MDLMRTTRRRRVPAVAILAILTVTTIAACSENDDSSTDEPGSGDSTTTEAATQDPTTGSEDGPGDGPGTPFAGNAPEEIVAPTNEGNGTVPPQPVAPLPPGYVEEELFIGGTATSFEATDTPDDGFWTATPGEEAEYRTRVLVRRPGAAEDFSGTVVVEWFNVSAIEAAPDWGYLSEEIGWEGHAYIGVSAQAQGVEGGATILDVQVDAEAAGEATGETGEAGPEGTDAGGLTNIDPERYGTLVHPGDAYAFDIFTQVGRAATEAPDQLLGGLVPTQVIGAGESQSAMFLSTLVNGVHPLDPVFDGFLIHSRGSTVAPLDGDFLGAAEVAEATDPAAILEQGVLIRTDLDVPVFIFEAETDLTLLGYAHARQPDTELIRTWEVAGTAHADAHTFRSMLGGPRDPGVGSLLGCTEPINTGPHHEVVQAALHHLVAWAAGSDPPPAGEPLGLAPGDEVAIARDDLGMAVGGVRNPLVDVPVAVPSGDPPGGASIEDLASGEADLCILFGSTRSLDRDTLVEMYGTADNYLAAFRASADEAVGAGFLLAADAEQLIAEAEENTVLFG